MSAATIPMANSTPGEIGRADSLEPDARLSTRSRARVTTNWLTWTRATVAAARVVETPRRVSIRRFRAAGPMPAGAASPTKVAAVCTSVARQSGSLTGENATNASAAPNERDEAEREGDDGPAPVACGERGRDLARR